jgi:nucleoside-diphosphate-sugar epimerase
MASPFHVVLGATGGAGSAVLRELVARGKRVRATSRKPPAPRDPNVEWVALDAQDASAVKRACDGAAVVYHCVNVPYASWERELIPLAENVMAAAAAANATLVTMDNLYMYGEVDGPIAETAPHRPVGHKGRLRSELEQRYLMAHQAGGLRLAIGRASDFYGISGNSAPMILAVNPILQGKRASWVASLDMPHTLSYLADVGWGLVTLGERPEALGQVWHIPAAEPLTGRQFITLVCDAAGQKPRMSVITKPMMLLAGLFDPQIREATEVYYQFARPFVMDASKFASAFGGRVTPHREAIEATVRDRLARVAS